MGIRKWTPSPIDQRTGWRRLGSIHEAVLGHALDKEEADLIASYRPRVRRQED